MVAGLRRPCHRAGRKNRSAQVEEAFRLAYSRQPDPWEKDRIMTFVSRQREQMSERQAKGEALALPTTEAIWTPSTPRRSSIFVSLC